MEEVQYVWVLLRECHADAAPGRRSQVMGVFINPARAALAAQACASAHTAQGFADPSSAAMRHKRPRLSAKSEFAIIIERHEVVSDSE